MSSKIPWDPFLLNGEFCSMSSGFESIHMIEVVYQLDAYNPVASELMPTQLINILSMQSIITHNDGSD